MLPRTTGHFWRSPNWHVDRSARRYALQLLDNKE
jgi:hypothetical protein